MSIAERKNREFISCGTQKRDLVLFSKAEDGVGIKAVEEPACKLVVGVVIGKDKERTELASSLFLKIFLLQSP